MAKKPNLLDVGTRLFPIGDAPLDVLSDVHGITKPTRQPTPEESPINEPEQQPQQRENTEMRAPQGPKTQENKKAAPAPPKVPKRELKVVNLRLYTDQIAKLRRQAVERSIERNEGKPDMSELVREILDAYDAGDSEIP
jgi:hypothetical protein